MITYLRMKNFRRHEDTELRFTEDQQLVLIAGTNGSGKSTIIEAITYALYGEGRNRVKQINSLVKWGMEVEGMEVECEFVVGDTTYRCVRRREGGKASAVLYGNDTAIMEGNLQVTQEVSAIFGMDAVGFRLAVIAQQKELDGLASLRPGLRGPSIARLLRLDAITKAKDQARQKFRIQKAVVKSLPEVNDVKELEKTIETTKELKVTLELELVKSKELLTKYDSVLAESEKEEEEYHKALETQARIEGQLKAVEQEISQIETNLAAIVVPPTVEEPKESLKELREEATRIELQLAKAESAKQLASQKAMLQNEIASVTKKLASLDSESVELGSAEKLSSSISQIDNDLESLNKQIEDTQKTTKRLFETSAVTKAALASVVAKQSKLVSLGAVCTECGQDVTKAHLDKQTKEAEIEKTALETSMLSIGKDIEENSDLVQELLSQRKELAEQVASKSDAIKRLEEISARHTELSRRELMYEEQIASIRVDDYDLEDLYAKKGRLAISVSQAEQAVETQKLVERSVSRRADILSMKIQTEVRKDKLIHDLEINLVDEVLKKAHELRQSQKEDRTAELDISNTLKTEIAVIKETLRNLADNLAAAEKAEKSRLGKHREAQVLSFTHQVLEEVENKLSEQIRPALQGSINEKLTILSQGRFSSVKVQEDYTILIEDDGEFRSIKDFSGGETDLIALAVRLSLASVVVDRSSSGGPGFLILDECFGSQDPMRRESILTALRALRTQYKQIFLISHIAGLEDAVDDVIEIEFDREKKVSKVVL